MVDDDAAVRKVVVRTLTKMGFQCDEASDGVEGLERIGRDHAELSLVVLDSIMPGLRGEEVFAKTRAFAPTLPILLVSGQLAPSDDAAQPYDDRSAFLAKPFATNDLRRAVDALVKVRAVAHEPADDPAR